MVCLAAVLIGSICSPMSWLHRSFFIVDAILPVSPTISIELPGIGLAMEYFIGARLTKQRNQGILGSGI